MMHASAARGPYTELGAIASALSVAYAGAPEIRFSRAGLDIVVHLRIDSGMVRGVDIQIARKGLPEIEFRRETDADRASKASGMNVEVQTGDPTFDGFVYIESAHRQAVLGPLLQSPELRRAIGELVGAAGTVAIDRDGITVDTRALGLALLEPARFLPVFGCLLRIAQLFPALPPGTATPQERGSGLVLLSALSFVVGIVLVVLLRSFGQPESSLPRVLGFAAGVALVFAARPLVRAWVKGHARSALYLQVTTVASLLGVPLVTMSLVVFVNAFFDSIGPRAAHRQGRHGQELRRRRDADGRPDDRVERWPQRGAFVRRCEAGRRDRRRRNARPSTGVARLRVNRPAAGRWQRPEMIASRAVTAIGLRDRRQCVRLPSCSLVARTLAFGTLRNAKLLAATTLASALNREAC
jgi:hypothetical protein